MEARNDIVIHGYRDRCCYVIVRSTTATVTRKEAEEDGPGGRSGRAEWQESGGGVQRKVVQEGCGGEAEEQCCGGGVKAETQPAPLDGDRAKRQLTQG